MCVYYIMYEKTFTDIRVAKEIIYFLKDFSKNCKMFNNVL